jgi:hypothetical protein
MLCARTVLSDFSDQSRLADLNGVLGNYATLGLNIADFSRYANKPSAQNVQAIVIPVIFSKLLPQSQPYDHLTNRMISQLLSDSLVSLLLQPPRRHMAISSGIQ